MSYKPLSNPIVSGTVEIISTEDFPRILDLVKEMKSKAIRITDLIQKEPFDPNMFSLDKDDDSIRKLADKYMNGKYIVIRDSTVCIHLSDEIDKWHLTISEADPITGQLSKIKDDLSKPICIAFLGEHYEEISADTRTGISIGMRERVRHFFSRKS